MNNNFSTINLKDKKQSKTTNFILGASIIWFFYGITIAIVSAICALFVMKAINFNFDKSWMTILYISIPTFIIVFVYSAMGPRMNFFAQLVMYTLSMIGLGISLFAGVFVKLVFSFSGYLKTSQSNFYVIAETLAVFIIPLIGLLIIGVLAYFDKIKMKLLNTILILLGVSLFVVFLFSFLIFNSFMAALFPVIGLALMMCYLALDMWTITRFNKAYKETMNKTTELNQMIFRHCIYFGFRLAYDYVLAVFYLWQLFQSK
ncbi:MAG0110 family membrane protein [Mycoplasmopsis felifaucium]|uniref:MAG0110 family membrane protein n=1 Tax=Mycoplasmopsis felifaucium TaxID=35768 RepID=UPI0006895994|nr:hypothetical protein [Mycoplasmopsis felifaucium]